jgi:WD40 repeat protein
MGIPSFILQRLHRIRGATCQRSIESDVPANCLAYASEGTEILVGHSDGIPRLWDTAHFELANEFVPHDAPVLSVAARASGWATSCARGRVRIWGGFGEPKREFRDAPGEPELPCWAVSWNRDGSRLLTAHQDRTLRLYDPERAIRLKKLGLPFEVRAVAFGPEDVQIALTQSGTAAMYEGDREAQSAIFMLGEPSEDANEYISFGFSRDRRMIATAMRSNDIHLSHWDDSVFVLRGHNDLVTSLAWSPEGRFLMSGSEDCTARIWDTTTRDCVVTINDVSTVRAVAFHPHGHDCATVTEDGTLRIYELDSEWFDLNDAILQATDVFDGKRVPLWPSTAPLDLDFVLDVWTDLRRRGRHSRISNDVAQKGEAVRRTALELLALLCGEATAEIPRFGLDRYKHPLFRVALADLRLAHDLCQRLGGDAIALADLQRLKRVPTTEVMTSGFSIPPKRV